MIDTGTERARADLEHVGMNVKQLYTETIANKEFNAKEGEDRGEVIANLILAYRHIEDARMRLGKVYQARNGGVSNSTK